jgi:hypothetical protein
VERIPDWGRIAFDRRPSVEEWNVYSPDAIDFELEEAARLHAGREGLISNRVALGDSLISLASSHRRPSAADAVPPACTRSQAAPRRTKEPGRHANLAYIDRANERKPGSPTTPASRRSLSALFRQDSSDPDPCSS